LVFGNVDVIESLLNIALVVVGAIVVAVGVMAVAYAVSAIISVIGGLGISAWCIF